LKPFFIYGEFQVSYVKVPQVPEKKVIHSHLYSTHNQVQLIRGGAAFFNKMEQMIDEAQHSILLQTYIYDSDETGRRIASALVRASHRKVQVYVLIDGFASQWLSSKFMEEQNAAGVHFSYFKPFFKRPRFYLGRSMHHKIIVTDAGECMVAGVNISNRYNDLPGQPAWLDWAIHVKGETAKELQQYCIEIWNKSVFRSNCTISNEVDVAVDAHSQCAVRVRKNDWMTRKTEITKSYQEMFAKATEHITVMSSYFWPAHKLLKRIAKASQKGVKIQLILAGTADVPLAKNAERYMYRWLFRHKIEIYEYQKNVLHGKIACYDDKWATIGSYNLNNISAYASLELNLDVKDTEFATTVNAQLQQIIANDCVHVTEAAYVQHYNFLQRFVQFLCYKLVHFFFFLFTFNFKQKSSND